MMTTSNFSSLYEFLQELMLFVYTLNLSVLYINFIRVLFMQIAFEDLTQPALHLSASSAPTEQITVKGRQLYITSASFLDMGNPIPNFEVYVDKGKKLCINAIRVCAEIVLG